MMSERTATKPRYAISSRDRLVLRDLAKRVAELAARPGEGQKRELWYRHNALEPTRPLVFCDPENGWNEILTPDRLQCEGRLARGWEWHLMWGFAESQETVGISPQMFEEFIFPYQRCLLECFGLNCYGCCEPLDSRWHVVKRFPRLRRVSMSPWANVEVMAEQLGNRYIFSWKPHPGVLAADTFDEELARQTLHRGLQALKRNDCRVEIIMKDCHTVRNDPQRVIRWVQIAKEEAEAL